MNAVLEKAVSLTFPSVLDNTMVSAYRACPRKFWWRHIEWLARGETSIHLISGGAFARGLEVVRKKYFDEDKPFDEALLYGAAALIAAYGNIEPHPKYSAKNVYNMVGALAYYFEQWPISRIITPYRPSADARHTIEWNFAVPLPRLTHPDTGQPLLYCGRFDMVAKHEYFPCLFGEDDKTTTQLGDSWFARWRLSSQILGYCWGAREHGINLGGFNVRGISLLKRSYGNAEAQLMVNDWMMDRWLENLHITAVKMIDDYKLSKLNGSNGMHRFEMNMGNTCSQFGGCDYLPLCEAPDPAPWIPVNFTVNEWNPLASRD